DTGTELQYDEASDQLGESGLELDLDTRAAVVSCCMEIMKAGVGRGSSRCDALYLASSMLHEPEDDLTIDAEVLGKLNLAELRADIQTVIAAAKAQAFDPELERPIRESWSYLGQQAIDFAKELPESELETAVLPPSRT